MNAASLLKLLGLLCVISAAEARIPGGKFDIDLRRSFWLDYYGFNDQGRCQIKLGDDSPTKTKPLFYLQARNTQRLTGEEFCARAAVFHEGKSAGSRADDSIDNNLVFVSVDAKEPAAVPHAGYWGLYYASCNDTASPQSKVHVEFYNVLAHGEICYLQVGDRPLPTVYLTCFVSYVMLLLVWGAALSSATKLNKLHYLLSFLYLMKCGTMLFEWLKYRTFATSGRGSAIDVFYYAFLMLKGVSLFTVILLIGSGWAVIKPFVAQRERTILMAVVPLQVLVNVFLVVGDEAVQEGSLMWSRVQFALHVLDVACCGVVMMPFCWNAQAIFGVEGMEEKQIQRQARLKQFKLFYATVILFVYFSRFAVVAIEEWLPYDYHYAAPMVLEGGTIIFYINVGRAFRPDVENAYNLQMDDDLGRSDRVEMNDL
ncbi:G protein coupled receptor [Diplonema papillatum]|nr:G protein coupled receptor [Diplonema papillatum]